MTAFDIDDYRFWFVRLTVRVGETFGIGFVGGAIIVALTPYGLGLGLAGLFGDARLYLRTLPFLLGCVGIAWVLVSGTQAVRILAAGLSELKRVTLDPRDFHDYVDGSLRRAAAWRTSAPGIVVGGLVLGGWVVVGLHRWQRAGERPTGHGIAAFPAPWHTGSALVVVIVVLALFTAVVAISLATSFELLLRNLRFAWGLQRFRYMPLPGRVRLALRPLINAYAWASITWSAGIALFVVLWLGNWSPVNAAVIVALALIGLATFLVPFWTFRRLLDASHEDMSTMLCKAVGHRSRGGPIELANVSAVAAANRAVAGDPPPVLTRRGAIAYVLAQSTTLAVVVAKGLLGDALSAVAAGPGSGARSRHDQRSSGTTR